MSNVRCFVGMNGKHTMIQLICDGRGKTVLRIAVPIETEWIHDVTQHIQRLIDSRRITEDNYASVEVGRPRKGGPWFVNFAERLDT